MSIFFFGLTLSPLPKYLEWYSPCRDLEHTIQVCSGDMINDIIYVHISIVNRNPSS